MKQRIFSVLMMGFLYTFYSVAHATGLETKFQTVQVSDIHQKQLLDELQALKRRDSLVLSQKRARIDSLRLTHTGVPIAPFGDTLFTIFNGLGSFTVEERAHGIVSRIQNLEENFEFHADSLRIQETEDHWLLEWQDQIVLSVNQQDALWANMEPENLIVLFKEKITEAIHVYRQEHSLSRLLTAAGMAIFVVFVVVLLIVGLNKIMNWVKRKLFKLQKKHFNNGVLIGGFQLISPNQELKYLWWFAGVLRWCLILTIVYLALPILFNLFPSTKSYASVLISYFLTPITKISTAIANYFPNFITILVVYFIFHHLLRILKFFANELESGSLMIKGFYKDWAIPTYHILRVLLLVFFLTIIFPYLPGAETPIFQGISVFFGILITFSSAGALGNIVAGLVLTYMRSFTVGDRIRIGDVTGDVIEKSLLVTRLMSPTNEVISIPNSQILSSHTTNYSALAASTGLIIHTKLAIAYEIPWERVHELAKEAVSRTPYLEKKPEPFILQDSLDDFYVTYQINAYTKEAAQQVFIYSELHKHILDVFHAAKIELMSPHFISNVDSKDTSKG